ncbi:MAG: SDR family oxidoreductase [Thermoplasmata archaeon]|nr:SDR family oxidoreductase [Thermoplasmata archaeon]MCI4359058.1 SDR family oxidoreductase [Thermoplasmata archaeon]
MKPWPDFFDLKGRVAIVTGGAMGIGEGIARRLAEQGASVVIADVDEEQGARTAADISRTAPNKSTFVRADLRDLGAVERAVETTVREFRRVDILVNNAGVFPFAPALEVSPEMWDRVLNVNLRGAFFMAQAVGRQMKQGGAGGAILNIASVDAVHPTGQLSAYDASKGGLRMLTRSLAFELAPHAIRVNAIAPGSIQTPGALAATSLPRDVDLAKLAEQFLARIPLHRMGEPDDIARAALFLVSSAASYVTGVTLVVDGGYLLS